MFCVSHILFGKPFLRSLKKVGVSSTHRGYSGPIPDTIKFVLQLGNPFK